jgi:uncharacterized phage protein (TIGR02216 family)
VSDAGAQPFPWAAALHFGLGLLRLAPAHFWAMSPRELMALAGRGGGALAPDRQALATLMASFPD